MLVSDLSPIESRTLLNCLHLRVKPHQLQSLRIDRSLSWETLFDAAAHLGVGPLLYFRLKDPSVSQMVPKGILQQRRGDLLRSQVQNMKVYAQLRKVLQVFCQEEVPVIVLKGALLAELVYQHIGLRTMDDVDLLVSKQDLGKAEFILEQLGFCPDEAYRPKDWYKVHHHHLVPYVSPDGSTVVEIHHDIIPVNDPIKVPIDKLWERARPIRIASIPCLTLTWEDLLVHLSHHICAQNEFFGQLREICDIAELIGRYGQEITWDELLRISRAYKVEKHVYFALCLARDTLGAAIPAGVLKQLRQETRLLPLEERLIRFIGSKAILLFDLSKHPLYEWILLDALKSVVNLRKRTEIVQSIGNNIVRWYKLARPNPSSVKSATIRLFGGKGLRNDLDRFKEAGHGGLKG